MSDQRILPPDAAPPPRQSWRERSWSLPVVVAVALVAVLLGGLAGAALASVGHDDGRRGPGFGRGFGGPGMPPGQRGFGPRWRFHDPYGSGPRQWDQRQQPRGPSGPLPPNGSRVPSPASPSPTS